MTGSLAAAVAVRALDAAETETRRPELSAILVDAVAYGAWVNLLELFPIEADRQMSLALCFTDQLHPTKGADWSDVALTGFSDNDGQAFWRGQLPGIASGESAHRRPPHPAH